jgi:Tfp pilus assembly protein PilF
MPEPATLAEFMRRGWAYHSRGKETQAEEDFRKALDLDPDNPDANYVLGLILKAQGKKREAVNAFQKTSESLVSGRVEDKDRNEMLRRLCQAHINELTEGDWKLEEEIWQYKE